MAVGLEVRVPFCDHTLLEYVWKVLGLIPIAPVGTNLADALFVAFGAFPLLCLTFGLLGAGLGARRTHPPTPAAPRPRT